MSDNTKTLEGLNVLLAEDDNMNVIVLTKFLSRWGIACDVARNGEEAVTRCRDKKYDLVLMDMYMPVMDGCQAARSIRTFDTDVKIFALTADSSSESREAAESSGMSDFVLKPFNPDQLYQKLASLKS